MYASRSCSLVGLLYASRLLMSLCPRIWSIQFEFIPAASRVVWRYFLRLWADRFLSLMRKKAFSTMWDMVGLGIRLALWV